VGGFLWVVLWHLPWISHQSHGFRGNKPHIFGGHDIECLGSRDVIDHMTSGLTINGFLIVTNSLSHTVSDTWRITGRKRGFTYYTLVRIQIWESYPSNFRTTLGPPSMGRITLLSREITFRLSQYIYPNPPTLQTDRQTNEILIAITRCARKW